MGSKRISREACNMQIATIIAQRGTCGRLRVGCIITLNNRIISTGYNGAPPNMGVCPLLLSGEELHRKYLPCVEGSSCSSAIHAEANAIANAARLGIALDGSVLYCTHSPCIKCAELIVQSGVKEVVYQEQFRDTSGLELLSKCNVNFRMYTDKN